jgi:hypothetical protein
VPRREGEPSASQRAATLSVCCIVNSPGPFLRAALAPLREIADEVVIAAGGQVPAEDLGQYAAVADRLFSIEFEFLERHLAWLHAQCHGDWILRLDGDEIPSAEMLDEVTAARADRSINGVFFARRNLFPTISSYIAQDPWYPDFQLRMVRNDGSLRFSGELHSGPERSSPARMVEAPIYHLPFIFGDLESRRARADRYERLRPGLVAPTGLPANQMELPETLPSLLTAPVPRSDVRRIEAVLSAPPRSPGPAEAISISLAEMDAYWSGRVLPESGYRARIDVIGVAAPLSPRERRPFYFRIHNEGSERWGWDPSVGPHVHVVHRLLDRRGAPVDDWLPSFFMESVESGSTTIVPAYVDAPDLPGTYRLEIRLRHAPVRLFGTSGQIEVLVRPGGAWRNETPPPSNSGGD